MKSADFTFIIPNTRWFGKRYWNHIPYQEGILSAVLRREGFSVNAIDANVEDLSEDQLAARIDELSPNIVGIGSLSIEYRRSVDICFNIVKEVKSSTKTVIGGVYPSLSPDAAMSNESIDFLIQGEGEERIVQLMHAIQSDGGYDKVDGLRYRVDGTIVKNPQVGMGIKELDTIPWPDYTDYNMEKLMNWGAKYTQNFQFRQFPVGMTATSRGCPYRCAYCAAGKDINPINDRSVRGRSPENVIGEIEQLEQKYGMREIIFVDDSLLLPRPRAIEMLKKLAERRKRGSELVWKSNNLDIRHVNEEILDWMLESGNYQLTFSLESGSLNTLKRMNRRYDIDKAVKMLKMMKEKGFEEVCSNFIIGYPGDSWDDIRETLDFADGLRRDGILDYVLFSIATPLPGTDLADQAAAGGYLPDDFDPTNFYGFGRGLITTEHFTPNELQILRAFEWDRINFKTKEDELKISRMLGITLDELEAWRKETRRNTGVQIATVNQSSSEKPMDDSPEELRDDSADEEPKVPWGSVSVVKA
jgi:anaerobic magnesium-protoporphyrin IX monomethyl ester cyclase